MVTVNDRTTERGRHCAYCGHAATGGAPAIERFGEQFCSEPHAEEFAARVRAARIQAAARAETPAPACAFGHRRLAPERPGSPRVPAGDVLHDAGHGQHGPQRGTHEGRR